MKIAPIVNVNLNETNPFSGSSPGHESADRAVHFDGEEALAAHSRNPKNALERLKGSMVIQEKARLLRRDLSARFEALLRHLCQNEVKVEVHWIGAVWRSEPE